MIDARNYDLPLDRLLDQLDEALELESLDTEIRASSSAALQLCSIDLGRIGAGPVDEGQSEALVVARHWLSDGGDVERE